MNRRGVTRSVLVALCGCGGCIGIHELSARTGETLAQIKTSCMILRRRGLAERRRPGCYAATTAGRRAVETGRRITSGPCGPLTGRRAGREGTMQDRAWRALRHLGKAGIRDIVVLAARGDERDPVGATRKYLRALCLAGYVAPLPKRAPGTSPQSRGYIRYLLLRNTGVRSPVWNQGAGTVWDPNTNETIRLDDRGRRP